MSGTDEQIEQMLERVSERTGEDFDALKLLFQSNPAAFARKYAAHLTPDELRALGEDVSV